jgi:DNA modification methylase
MVELIWDGKYDAHGKRTAPLRIQLPFQTVETVNESAQQRQLALDLFSAGRPAAWRNRLIWGDKKYVLPALLDEFAGQVDLIYIDPPFNVGADFSFTTFIPDDPDSDEGETATFTKQPSVIEQKAYRDTWGQGLDSYLQWFYETVVLLRELLTEDGSLYVHLDWHVGHYAKLMLDEVFGQEGFTNEIIWYYYNKLHDSRKRLLPRAHDVIYRYARTPGKQIHNPLKEPREKPVKKLRYRKVDGQIQNVIGADGKAETYLSIEKTVDDVWRIRCLQPANQKEWLGYNTQKPENLIERIVTMSSNPGDLVLDCFCGSGTTAAVAEKLGRRWIACDLGRFAIHTTRKRLLSLPGVRPFVVQNLGKYERQAWQAAEFGGPEQAAGVAAQYRRFILELYHARPIQGYTWLHGLKSGRMVHVGAVDAPISPGDVQQIALEFRKAAGTGQDAPSVSAVDVLGWDFAFELNEVARQQAAQANIQMRFLRIPREVLEKKAVEQGDIRFFELAALAVEVAQGARQHSREVTLRLTDFVIPPDDVPTDVQAAITHWAQWIDYWAVDWDNKGDTFHNMWQTYRTRKEKSLKLQAGHKYDAPGAYTIMVKVIDILGNDTTKTLHITVP